MEQLKVSPGDTAALAALDTKKIFDAQNAAVSQVKSQAPRELSHRWVRTEHRRSGPAPRPLSRRTRPRWRRTSRFIIGTNKDEMRLFMLNGPSIATRDG